MEKLKLTCGRFMPSRGGEPAERVERIEAYLTKLTEELEYLLGEMDEILDMSKTAVVMDGEEGTV